MEENPAEASKRRIAAAGSRWYQVLDLKLPTTVEDVKKAYRKLVLLHHPDKGGDVDTFKRVQQAYEAGVKKCRVRERLSCVGKGAAAKGKGKGKGKKARGKAQAKGKAGPPAKASGRGRGKRRASEGAADGDAPKAKSRTVTSASSKADGAAGLDRHSSLLRECVEPGSLDPLVLDIVGEARIVSKLGRPQPVALDASASKLQKAVSKWEDSQDFAKKTMPDDVPRLSAQQVDELRRLNACIVVDAREDHECVNGESISGAQRLPFVQAFTAPEAATLLLARLQEDGRLIILFTQHGGRMGRCSLLGALLLDVFGFSETKLFCIDGGLDKWSEYVATQPLLHAQEALAAAQRREREAEERVVVVATKVHSLENSVQAHLKPLETVSWKVKKEAEAHLAALDKPMQQVEVEESLRTSFLAGAMCRAPPDKGPFTALVFSEVEKRFQFVLDDLREQRRILVEEAVKMKAQIEAAEAEVARVEAAATAASAATPVAAEDRGARRASDGAGTEATARTSGAETIATDEDDELAANEAEAAQAEALQAEAAAAEAAVAAETAAAEAATAQRAAAEAAAAVAAAEQAAQEVAELREQAAKAAAAAANLEQEQEASSAASAAAENGAKAASPKPDGGIGGVTGFVGRVLTGLQRT